MSELKVYEKKPVRITAAEYDGSADQEIVGWCGGKLVPFGQGFWGIEIQTLEGIMLVSPGDFIICGIQGEFYPCKPSIFHGTYTEVNE